ncbi:hypothetical protein ACLB2K_035542 [Fragaria x ananassa]
MKQRRRCTEPAKRQCTEPAKRCAGMGAKVGYVQRENSRMPGYYDGRYWTLWKLPMFGCIDPSLVLNEIQECKKTYPNAYIRCVAFDNQNQG